ncbi:electron transport complex subunit RsxG [Teredinibacter haidensis]|uniref:electron transport complex subunit RsxG n=1 Tax=Teredinibacter haidensis TaxID=2731755 RepID=UPI00094890CA|nr:electron transport complex subunit RsxG [Teredinibacter haidensis]
MSEITVSRLEVWRSRVDYQGLILGAICAVVTFLLLVGERTTYQPIQERLAEDRMVVLTQVLPQEMFDNKPLEDSLVIEDTALSNKPIDIYLARKSGLLQAVVFQIETEGYGGTITLMVGINTSGEILGLRTLSHKETPGLADKIEMDKSSWITVFNGESLHKTPAKDWAVKKDGGKFDQFTGATITPRAIVKGVVSGLEFYARHSEELIANGTVNPEEVSAL